MKTTKITKMFLAMIIAGTMGVYNVQAQTYGRGALTNNATCGATGTTGGCTNTYIGDVAGAAVGASSLDNTFIGASSGNANTSGVDNSFFGYKAGFVTTTGSYNTFTGALSGQSNTTGNYNVFYGRASGNANTTGTLNTFIGYTAGYKTVGAGSSNTSVGHQAFHENTSGDDNVAVGLNALYANTTANKNTAVGNYSGDTYATGDSCTFLGYGADKTSTYQNCAAIGFGTAATASDKMFFGNSTIIGCYNVSGVWTFSDGRFKFNVKEEVKGLDFIKRLRPVTYQLNTQQLDAFIKQNMPRQIDSSGKPITTPAGNYTKSMNIVRTGFIAQEVEQAAKEAGFASTIVSTPSNTNDPYAVRYEEFVVPLVKAVQELSKTVDSLKTVISKNGQSTINNGVNASIQDIKLALPDGATLGNAQPNPNNGSTQIPYYLPQNTTGAKIIFTDMLGKVMEEKTLQAGYGLLNIDTQDLPGGIYSYSLVVGDKVIDNKKMIRNK